MSEFDVKWIPVSAAAKMLGISRQRCNKLCRMGALGSIVVDSTRLVSRRSVEARREALIKEEDFERTVR